MTGAFIVGPVLLPEVHQCIIGVQWCQLALSSWRGEFVASTVQEASQKSELSPLVCPRLPSSPSLYSVCVSAIHPFGNAILLCYCFWHPSWVSELPNFRDLVWHGLTLILWR